MPLTEPSLSPGTVFAFAGTSAPTGYLLCDGSAVSRSDFNALFNAIGVAHGSGDGTTTFNIPDYRGRFHRGWDNGQGRDPDAGSRTTMASGGNSGDAIGTLQGHAFQTHTHSQNSHQHPERVTAAANGVSIGITGVTGGTQSADSNTTFTGVVTATNQNQAASGANSQASNNETRPHNASANYIIKI